MENKNIQQSQSAHDLAGSLSYPAGMIYKRPLGGVAVASYTLTPGVWAWTWTWIWTTRECMVPGAHKEEVSNPFKPANKLKQRKKHVNACNYLVIY